MTLKQYIVSILNELQTIAILDIITDDYRFATKDKTKFHTKTWSLTKDLLIIFVASGENRFDIVFDLNQTITTIEDKIRLVGIPDYANAQYEFFDLKFNFVKTNAERFDNE